MDRAVSKVMPSAASVERTFYGSVAVGVLNRIDRPLLLIRSRLAKQGECATASP